jgi:hypothetical protein
MQQDLVDKKYREAAFGKGANSGGTNSELADRQTEQ